MDRLEGIFNWVEGVWWIGLGIWMLVRARGGWRKETWLAGIVVLFGISDFAEVFTGAWWQPWWLLAWKAGCLISGAVVLTFLLRERGWRWKRK